jgi:hypothetical protein
MLTTFLGWSYFSCLSILYGFLSLHAFRKLFRLHDDHPTDLPLLALLGFCSIGLITEALAVVMGINLAANLIILFGGLLIVLAWRQALYADIHAGILRFRGWHPMLWLIFAAALLFVLVKSTDLPLNYDTGLYHTQTIRWIEAYGTVPGLGNLHARLAYNSVWFPLLSLTSLSFMSINSFHIAGSLLLLLTLLLLLDRLNALSQGVIQLSSLMSLVLIFVSRRLFSRELSSPGTDMPTSLFFWVVLLLWVEKWERGESWEFDLDSVTLTSLSLYAVTIKLTALPILLLPGAMLFSEVVRGHWRTIPPFCGLSLAIFLPWTVRGVILSGYLVYPFAPLDLFSFDWKIPGDQVLLRMIGDRSWARSPGQVGSRILRQPPWRWMPHWYRRQEGFDQQLLILALASMLGFISTQWLVRRDRVLFGKSDLAFWLPYIACGAGLVYWIYSAPYVRFGYPVLGILIALAISPGIAWILARLHGLRTIFVTVALASAIAVHLVSLLVVDPGSLQERWIRSAPYPKIQSVERQLGEQTIRIPKEGDQCWDTPIPCTPRVDTDLRPRGDSLASGYRILAKD